MTTFALAIAIFAVVYVFIIWEKVHRTVVALAGATLMITLGVLHQEQAIEGIDFNTLGLLIGLMVVVGIAKHSGVFQFVAIWATKVAKGNAIMVYALLAVITAVFSAFLDNVTTVLLMVPVIFVIANQLNVHVKPFLVGTILISNIGGAATLIGDPPNIMIGSASGLSFNSFLWNLGPVAVITGFVTIGILLLWYKKDLISHKDAAEEIAKLNPKDAITDWPLLSKSLAVLGIIMIGFFTHSATGLEGATIALAGASLLLLFTLNDPEHHLQEVEWTTIFFFSGLFVLVAGLEEVGAIHILAEKLLEMTGGDLTATTIALLWGSAVFSAAVDNIPFVATMIPLVQDVSEIARIPIEPLWWALALGADFGGNATLIGASANVIVNGMAEKEGQKLGFLSYMKTAVPLTILSLIIATIYMYLRYLV